MSVYIGGSNSGTDYVGFFDGAPWDPAGAWTIYLRFMGLSYPNAVQSAIAAKWQASADRSWLLSFSSGDLSFNTLGADNNGYGAALPAPRLGIWQSAAGVFTGSSGTVSVWSEGRISTAAYGATTIKNSTTGVTVGNRSDSPYYPFNGFVKDLAVWDAALSNVELLALDRGASPLGIRKGSLNGYWPFADSLSPIPVGAGTATGTRNGAVILQSGEPFGVGFFFAKEITSPDILPPFLNVGVGLYAPGISDFITPPFFNVGVGIKTATMFDGGQPPFVPPSLPPTIPPGTGAGPGVPLPPLSSGGLAGIRFYLGPPWRWVVTDLETATITFLDKLAAEATITYKLDGGAVAKLTVPSDNPEVNILHTDGEPFVSEGNRLLYGFRREGDSPLWVCRFAGKILLVEDSGLAEDARTSISAFDPWHLLYQRPMVNFDDEFPDKAGFFSFDNTQTGVIALTFLRNTIVNSGEVGIDMGDNDFASVDNMPGTTYWGHPYQAVWSGRTKSKYETTTQIDTDCQQGMMVGEVWDQQVQTGTLDLLLTPIYDPVNRPGMMAELSIYERAGVEAADAVFSWDLAGRNLKAINSVKDGTKRANTIRYYQNQGGGPVNAGIPISYGPSILKYGETWHTQFFPSRNEEAILALEQLQLDLMQDGIHTVAITPAPERMPFLFTEWWLGDTVPVFASSKLRAPIAGFQRIYGIVLTVDANSYEQVPQVLVSPDTA